MEHAFEGEDFGGRIEGMITIVENAAMGIEGQKGIVRGVEALDGAAQVGTRNVGEGAVAVGAKAQHYRLLFDSQNVRFYNA
mmetsp:Transcript_14943/g.31350  ORF Transcript_14943/g.31350 Transcript_14943/m.31350 type:complete len:81 (+) Transcript_14943:3123-3365(+)